MKKKIFLFMILFIGATLLVGCTEKKGYTEITYKELEKKVEDKDTFALFIGRTSCSACDVFKTILNDTYAKDYAKESTIYYIDLDDLTDEEDTLFHSKYSYSGTPTVTIITEGKFSPNDSVSGSDKYNDMIDKMRSKGLIK